MTKVLTVLLLLSSSLQAQDSLLTFSKIVFIDSASKTQLFERARHWATDYFRSAKTVLQVSDKESGELIAKPLLSCWYTYHYFGADHRIDLDMPVTIRILVKENKYKAEVYDISTTWAQTGRSNPYGGTKPLFGVLTTSEVCPVDYPMIKQKKVNEQWNQAKQNASKEIDKLLTELNRYMSNQGAVGKDDF